MHRRVINWCLTHITNTAVFLSPVYWKVGLTKWGWSSRREKVGGKEISWTPQWCISEEEYICYLKLFLLFSSPCFFPVFYFCFSFLASLCAVVMAEVASGLSCSSWRSSDLWFPWVTFTFTQVCLSCTAQGSRHSGPVMSSQNHLGLATFCL